MKRRAVHPGEAKSPQPQVVPQELCPPLPELSCSPDYRKVIDLSDMKRQIGGTKHDLEYLSLQTLSVLFRESRQVLGLDGLSK